MNVVQTNTPKLRFSEFNGEWKEKIYNQIYSFYSTNSFSRDNLNYEEGGVKNIHYGDIHTKFSTLFDLNKELVPFINKEVNISRIKEENYVKEGDLLIADASEDYSDIGKTVEVVNINNEKVLSGLHTFHARPNKYEMAIGFSGYMLQNWNVRKQVMKIAQGTKVLGLATSRLGNITLNIPEFEEQQKIASFLTTVDKKITQLQKKKTLLEQYKKGVMQQIFNQELRFKDDIGNSYPDWEEKKLLEFEKIIHGDGDWILSKDISKNGSHKIVQLGNIGFGKYIDKELKTISTQKFVELNGTPILKGDLLINRMVDGDINCCLLEKNGDYITSVDVCWIRENDYFNNYFFMSLILFQENQNKLLRLSSGSGRVRISKKNLFEKFSFMLPSIQEQTKIANFLSEIDKKIELVNTQLENTQQFKKGLLQQMFV